MRLTVLQVAHAFTPVRRGAGTAEHVLAALDGALVAAGHRSLVLAPEGSEVRGKLLALPVREGPITVESRGEVHARRREALAGALRATHVDVVHFHGVDFAEGPPPPGPACLVTLYHGPERYPPDALAPEREATWLHGVSRSQRFASKRASSFLPPIELGVAAGEEPEGREGREHALVLDTVRPEHGIELALAAAELADAPLVIVGRVEPFPEHQAYFRMQVQPRLDERRRFLGAAGAAERRELLRRARCLLLPHPLVPANACSALEALAAGVAVIAFEGGIGSDVVAHGRNGFLVRDAAGMAEALGAAAELEPSECVRSVRERFPLERMVRRYFERYRKLARDWRGSATRR